MSDNDSKKRGGSLFGSVNIPTWNAPKTDPPELGDLLVLLQACNAIVLTLEGKYAGIGHYLPGKEVLKAADIAGRTEKKYQDYRKAAEAVRTVGADAIDALGRVLYIDNLPSMVRAAGLDEPPTDDGKTEDPV